MRPLLRSLAPALFTGGLLGLAFPIRGLEAIPTGWLAMIAFVPLLVDIERDPRAVSRVFAEALLAHMVAYGLAFQWVAAHPIWSAAYASVGGLMVLAGVASLPWAAGAWLRKQRPTWSPVLAFSIPWAVGTLMMEHLLSIGPLALPWTVLSLTQAPLPHASLAAMAGGPALTALVVAANTGFAHLLWSTQSSASPSARRSFGMVPLALVLAVAVVGPRHAPPAPLDADVDTSGPPLRLTIVQPAVDAEQWARIDTDAAVRRLQTMTHRHQSRETVSDSSTRPRTDLIVWPETALPPSMADSLALRSSPLLSFPAPLLTGAVRPVPPSSAHAYRRFRNEALLLDSRASPPGDNAVVQRYAKHHLVPFAEHVPLIDDVAALRYLTVPAGGVAGYVRGAGPTVFSLLPARPSSGGRPTRFPSGASTVRIAPIICFESTIGPYMREIRRDDPRAVIALSQVGWWGDTSVLPQYRALTSLRARETGLPVVVATVSGPSFTAHPNGRVDLHTAWMDTAVVDVRVPPSISTLYARTGGIADIAVALGLTLYLFVLGWRSRYSRQDPPATDWKIHK